VQFSGIATILEASAISLNSIKDERWHRWIWRNHFVIFSPCLVGNRKTILVTASCTNPAIITKLVYGEVGQDAQNWQIVVTADNRLPSPYAESNAGDDFCEFHILYNNTRGASCEATAGQIYLNR